MVSHFDLLSREFTCTNPECGKPFKKVLRSLLNSNEVSCPACGHTEDITESKRTGPIGLDFHTASELDKKANKKS